MVKRIILITGTPGVGKTTISRILASKLCATHIDVGELVKRENLISGVDTARGTLIIHPIKVSKRLQQIIEETHQDLVVDGHSAVEVVPKNQIHLVFVLRRDPTELQRLYADFGSDEKKLEENVAAEILDVCLYDAVISCGQKKVCEVDVSGKKVEDVVDEIISILNGDLQCQVGIVDWLGKLDREQRLDTFFQSF